MFKKTQSFLLLYSITMMFIFGCSEDSVFKEIKVDSSELENVRVIAFGTGRSVKPKIAMKKAEISAYGNLSYQVAGSDFVYEKANNSVKFSTKSKGKFSGVQLVDSYDLSDNRYLAIISAPPQKRDFDQESANLLETEFRTENLGKALSEKYRIAVEETLSRNYKNKTRLTGKLYLTGISLSDYEGKPDFAVNMKVLIVVSDKEQ